MLNDSVRNSAYWSAIKKTIEAWESQNDSNLTILDVGTGNLT
jgi:hypothetical protein